MRRRFYAAVLAVAVLAHAGALSGGFSYDDHIIVESNPRLVVRSVSDLGTLLGSSWWGPSSERTGERLFRPLPLATFALERAIAGKPDASLSRVVDVGLHVFASLLVLALLLALIAEPLGAFAGALLFAAHPLHAEAVSGIVGRAEVLALLFGVLALLVHVRGGTGKLLVLEGAAFFLALSSKESALAVLPIAVAIDLLLPGSERKTRRFVPYAVLGGALVLYLSARAWALGGLVPGERARTLGDMELLGRMKVALVLLKDYWSAVLFPISGTAAHFPYPDTSTAGVVVSLAIQDALLVAVWLLARRGARRGKVIALGLVAFEVALLPVLNLIPIGVLFAERLLYAPSVWPALAIGAAVGPFLERLKPLALPIRVTAALLTGTLVFSSSSNDRVWGDDLLLWQATVDRFPDEWRGHLGLGELQLEEGLRMRERDHDRVHGAAMLALAKKHLDAAMKLFPEMPPDRIQPLQLKAYVLEARAIRAITPRDSRERPAAKAEAERAFARALDLDPRYYYGHLMRGQARMEDDEDKDAIPDLRAAHALAPEQYEGAWYLGLALIRSGDAAAAVPVLTEAIPLAQSPGEALFLRFEARWSLGERQGALEDYSRAAELLPRLVRLELTAQVIQRLVVRGERPLAQALLDAIPKEHEAELNRYVAGRRNG